MKREQRACVFPLGVSIAASLLVLLSPGSALAQAAPDGATALGRPGSDAAPVQASPGSGLGPAASTRDATAQAKPSVPPPPPRASQPPPPAPPKLPVRGQMRPGAAGKGSAWGKDAEVPAQQAPAVRPLHPTPSPPPKRHHKVHFFMGWTTGLGWWHHYEPPVIGSMRGALGLSWNWLEVSFIVGSPAWGRWSKTAYFEFGVMVGIRSLRWGRLALIHRAGMGTLWDNPPFRIARLTFRVVPALLAYRLWRGLWLEGSPLTITALRLEQFETTLGLRYEF